MTTNKPEIVAWGIFYRGVMQDFGYNEEAAKAAAKIDFHGRMLSIEPLIRLSDYETLQAEYRILESELATVKKVAYGNVDLLDECEKLRRDAELWDSIHDEIHRRADKEHALADRCDFGVTIMYEDYAAIDAAMEGDKP